MHQTRIHTAIIILFSFFASLHATPKLTVVVMVDGLCENNLNMMQAYWPVGGLRTLSEEAYQATISFPSISYGGAENIATLLTGETSARHGIMLSQYFSRNDKMIHSSLEDTSEKGIGTIQQLSPRALLTTNLSDLFRLQFGRDAHIVAIGQDAETAILMAGHAANSCSWMDTQSQQWVSTTYYPDGLPSTADEINISTRIADLCSRDWTPRMAVNMYNMPTERELKHGFHYKNGKILHRSPAINTLSIELALNLQAQQQLGQHIQPDLMLIQLTTLTPLANSDHIMTAEQEDLHLHLNQDLGYLMEQLQRRLGQEQIQFFVIGVPRMGISTSQMAEIGMPIKKFNVERAAALTSAYLMALYGHEKWVEGGYGQSIFLNRSLIEQKRLSLESIQRQVANFLMDFEGIQVAYPSLDAYTDSRLSPVLCKRAAGDVVFLLQDGWQLTYGDDIIIDQLMDAHPTAPILIWPTINNAEANNFSAQDIIQLIKNTINL